MEGHIEATQVVHVNRGDSLVWSDSRWSVLFFCCGALCYAVISCLYHRVNQAVLGKGLLKGKRSAPQGCLLRTSRGNTHYIYRKRPGVEHNLVVLIHGFAGSSEVFYAANQSNYVEKLFQSGHDVLTFDLYGHGHSEGPDTIYDCELFSEQLFQLCFQLNIQKKFDILAFSMGASVAASFAHKYPFMVDRLVLQSPSIVDHKLRMSLRFALYVPVLREIVLMLVIPRLGRGACANNAAVIRASYRLLRTNLRNGGRWMQYGEEKGALEMIREVSAQQRMEILCLWGRKDTVIPASLAKVVQAELPHAEFVFFPEATHDSFAETDAAMFVEPILRFLERHG